MAEETEQQKAERANSCMAEIQESLKKYNCRFKVTVILTSENTSQFLVNVTTN